MIYFPFDIVFGIILSTGAAPYSWVLWDAGRDRQEEFWEWMGSRSWDIVKLYGIVFSCI